MIVCIIAEGSYPYISGGVSSWINQLITDIEDIEFKIFSIMPDIDEKLSYKYKIPDNVSKIETISLQDYKKYNPKPKNFDTKLFSFEKKNIKKFLRFDKTINWDIFVNSVTRKSKVGDPIQFLHSEYFWNNIKDLYIENYDEEGFNEFFWTLRSMFLFFMTLIQETLPKADLYHSVSTGYSGFLGLIQKIKKQKPFLLTEHGIYAREREEEIIQSSWVKGIYKKMWIDFFYFIANGAYKKADIVVSLFGRNKMFQLEHGADYDKTVVVPNGIDIEKYNVKKINAEQKNIGAILRIVPIKDVKTLLRSFKIVTDDFNDANLFLIGPYDENPKYYKECLKLIKNLNLEDRVIITGKVDIEKYLGLIDVMVLTSISEGQPLVILESMAAKIPFVATDVGGCKELLYGKKSENIGKSGVIVKPVSPVKTATAILNILKDDNLAKRMGENGYKRVQRYYQKKYFINKYKTFYSSLVR
ncbi:MAG TPA: GT4 family glycosyltransferase PelF [Candidatus Mcinerneyibacterium sp.]|nr:GT4 family glycosyltransferase PelF [Candidatus Mcinerneyibacterium sp.]